MLKQNHYIGNQYAVLIDLDVKLHRKSAQILI